ncbi:MAG: hypothetical protein AAGH79_13300, partial [Bacteroidota bacterium]
QRGRAHLKAHLGVSEGGASSNRFSAAYSFPISMALVLPLVSHSAQKSNPSEHYRPTRIYWYSMSFVKKSY